MYGGGFAKDDKISSSQTTSKNNTGLRLFSELLCQTYLKKVEQSKRSSLVDRSEREQEQSKYDQLSVEDFAAGQIETTIATSLDKLPVVA
jgi:hypothetical protein